MQPAQMSKILLVFFFGLREIYFRTKETYINVHVNKRHEEAYNALEQYTKLQKLRLYPFIKEKWK